MAILNEYKLHQLAILSYIEFHETIENKRDGLIAMGILPEQKNISDEDYAKIISQTLEDKLDKKYLKIADSLCVLQENSLRNIEINVVSNHYDEDISWEVVSVDGKVLKGKIKVAEAKQVNDFEGNPMRREVGGVVYERRSFEISQAELDAIGFNYHKLKLNIPGIKDVVETSLAYAPEKCYQPIDITKDKVRGTAVAIPSIRSNENLGIGNYSDLAQFSATMAQNGLDIVGTLPIHAMPHKTPESASPYSPISRTFFNFGYLDLTAIQDFKDNQQIQQKYDSAEYEKLRRKNQDAWTVDYTTSYELLMPMLEDCYKSFCKNATNDRRLEFEKYKAEKGDDLTNFALWQALTEHFCSQKQPMPDWRDWPKQYQNPDSLEVKDFAKENKQVVDFFSYLQWETLNQIKNVQKTCKDFGMKIGFYNDLAVGTIPSGFEAWAHKGLYVKGSIGIPPDMCSAEGQNWGIIGYNPNALEEQGFKPFIKMMEANMQGGMLRIDCPLCGFVAANFIPEGKTAKDCFSIYMPTDKMMALTALTSNLTKTPIVFEDLGAIPHYFREKIQKMNGITYKVLPYERCSTRDFPASSLVVSSTHDSESLNIGWKGESAYLLENHNCLPSQYVNNYLKDTYEYRKHIVGLLRAEGIADFDESKNFAAPKGYYKAMAELIGKNEHCSSGYGIMPIGDILGLPHWRENLPGTAELHTSKSENAKSIYDRKGSNLPNNNWRLKLPLYLNEIAVNPRFLEVTSALSGNEDKEVLQYTRLGRNEEPRRDANRLARLYAKFAETDEKCVEKGEKTRFSEDSAYAIWGARFSPKRKAVLEKKATEQSEDFKQSREAIEAKKNEYRKSIMTNKLIKDKIATEINSKR